jgi:hypothetical protein
MHVEGPACYYPSLFSISIYHAGSRWAYLDDEGVELRVLGQLKLVHAYTTPPHKPGSADDTYREALREARVEPTSQSG